MAKYSTVRVVVSDNGEPSWEMDQVKNWCSARPQFSFRRNPGNIGADANIALGFTIAHSDEVLWILADDTLIKPKALACVMAALEFPADLYAFSRVPVTQSYELFDFEDVGMRYALQNYPWGLISYCLYDMQTFSNSIEQAFTYHNSSFAHLGVLFGKASKLGVLRVLWLNEFDVISDGLPPTKPYVRSLTGMPQLFGLAPDWERRQIALDWIWRYGTWLYRFRYENPSNFLMTLALLRNYGGFRARVLLRVKHLECAFTNTRTGSILERSMKGNHTIRRLLKR